MKDPANLEAVCPLMPDYVGYIFFRGSRRYVGNQPDPALFSIPPDNIARVGVFVNEPLLSVKRIVGEGWLDMVQLHGSESPGYCKALMNEGVHVIKSTAPVNIGRKEFLRDYYGVIHNFIFDSQGEGKGGTGLKFNWELLEGYSLPVPYLLSGGIGPEDAREIRGIKHFWLHGVDVNSRFELSPGIKDIGLLREFINEIRK